MMQSLSSSPEQFTPLGKLLHPVYFKLEPGNIWFSLLSTDFTFNSLAEMVSPHPGPL
jgi:hypothetical protein